MTRTGSFALKDKISVLASIVALIISLFGFFRDSILNQHVLRAAVVAIDDGRMPKKLTAKVLLVNAGKHYETLYSARFIFADDLTKGGGSLSREGIGPTVLKPGEAMVLSLDGTLPDDLRNLSGPRRDL